MPYRFLFVLLHRQMKRCKMKQQATNAVTRPVQDNQLAPYGNGVPLVSVTIMALLATSINLPYPAATMLYTTLAYHRPLSIYYYASFSNKAKR